MLLVLLWFVGVFIAVVVVVVVVLGVVVVVAVVAVVAVVVGVDVFVVVVFGVVVVVGGVGVVGVVGVVVVVVVGVVGVVCVVVVVVVVVVFGSKEMTEVHMQHSIRGGAAPTNQQTTRLQTPAAPPPGGLRPRTSPSPRPGLPARGPSDKLRGPYD